MTPDRSQRCTHLDDEWCDDCFIPARHTRTLTALDDPYDGYEIGEAVMNGFTIADADTGEHLAGPKPGDTTP